MSSKISLMLVWIITEVFCDEPVTVSSAQKFPANFRCNNGKYIDNRWFCDNDLKDCGDLSDEGLGCSKEYCGNGKFKCYSDGPCIDIIQRCNTLNDCPDGSDEIGCGDETNITDCGLHKASYLCKDKLKCLHFNYTCDGVCNCFDCSDETEHCKKLDSESCKSCLQSCLPTPTGPQCVCDSDNISYEMNKLCKEIEDCSGNLSCSQNCISFRNITRCLCDDLHHEVHDPDGVKCRKNCLYQAISKKEGYLVYSTTTKIKLAYQESNFNNTKILQSEVNCTVLAATEHYVYYVNRRQNKDVLYEIFLPSSKTAKKIMEFDSNSTIQSLAVDSITMNLYFTTNKSLSVCSKNGSICTQLKCCVVDEVVLASRFGWMFYTYNIAGQDEQLIMKSNMDGSKEITLLDLSFQYPTSLAIDEWNNRVYCFEMETLKLYSAFYDGSDGREYPLLEWGFSTHFSTLERYSFFIKERDNMIYIAENANFKNFTTWRDKDTNYIRDLVMWNPYLEYMDETFMVNPCFRVSCGGLCLLHSTPLTKQLNCTCKCANFIPSKDNPWCSDHPAGSDSELKIVTKIEEETDSPTESFSTSMKNEPLELTKASTILSTPSNSPSCEISSTIGIFYVISGLAFAFSILTLIILVRNHFSIRGRQSINIVDQIEL